MPKISEIASGGSPRGTDKFLVVRDGANVTLELRDIAAIIPKGDTGPQGLTGDPGSQGPAGPPGTTSWVGITDKPSTFTPTAHAHAISEVTGLQAALDAATGGAPNLSGAWPIGSIFMSAIATNPATLLGFGTWTAFGAGRMPVGFQALDPDFGTLLGTGGAKTHTLTVAEMPSHTHVQNAHSHTIPVGATDDTAAPFDRADAGTNASGANATTATGDATAVNQNTGGGGAHNNLPPYITVHLWQRTA